MKLKQEGSYVAVHRHARLSARKARLIADQIRGETCNRALELLEFAPQRAAYFYKKVVMSAMANATQNEEVNVNQLFIHISKADEGPMLNGRLRWRPGPQGRAMPFAKKTAHLTVVVREMESQNSGGDQ